MLYLVGIGLQKGDISVRGMNIVKEADRVYIEKYTNPIEINFDAIELSREEVESEKIVEEARYSNVVLLVPGDPLAATTHFQLMRSCIEKNVGFEIIHASSIYIAVAETGLHLYKFGKSTTLPKPRLHYNPKSYLDVIRQNDLIGAHTLLLVDPDLEFDEAREILVNDIGDRKVLVCSRIGTSERFIRYGPISKLKVNIKKPFCFIIPNPNQIEMEALRLWEEKGEEERS